MTNDDVQLANNQRIHLLENAFRRITENPALYGRLAVCLARDTLKKSKELAR